jgi:hypothetical protein
MPDKTAGEQRPMIWRYDGQWSKIPEPYEWDGTSDFNEAFERAGFRSSRPAASSWNCSLHARPGTGRSARQAASGA